jgi:hypothetical protein
MLITTKNKKHIYCYRENGTLATDWFFLDILLDYLFGNTDIDPQYKYGEYQNLSSSQKKQLKKEYEESYETRKNW